MIIHTERKNRFIPNRARLCNNNRAAVLVEMALVLPVLLLMLIIAIDLSRFLIISNSLNNAIQQGVMVGASTPLNLTAVTQWRTTIENAIISTLSAYPWFNPADLTVDVPTPSTSNGLVDSKGFQTVRVSLSYQTAFVMPWPGLATGHTFELTMESDQVR